MTNSDDKTPKSKKTTFPLERALSKIGYLSRSKTRTLIDEGRVKVNGNPVSQYYFPVNPVTDIILIDNEPIKPVPFVYLIMNKPKGAVPVTVDEHTREAVFKELPEEVTHIFPVGRLDYETEGLLLYSNDTKWAARITEKEAVTREVYTVQVMGTPDEETIEQMRLGIFEAGYVLKFDEVQFLKRSNKTTIIQIVLSGMRSKEIRRMMSYFEFEILHLTRTEFGSLKLGDLEKGETKLLLKNEIESCI